MPFIEAPTTFYLGRRYDPQQHRVTDDVVYYDSRDLTTHAVVVGMTGSGKTGLCINLLEEAILDNIPAIVIDPKGDITNLLLTFPDFRPEDFSPWVNVDDARRAGQDVPAYSADVAKRWEDGLESWGIVSDRVRWLQRATQYSIFTPGSDAGLPISILASLRAPREGWAGNEEAIREKINAITTALLALAGINAEPMKDAEHVLIANIFEHSWRQGIDLSMEDLILQIQRPPFPKLGVFQVDDFMPEKKRAKLAMDLNNIIAAPSFQSWMQGQPLDIQSLMYQPNGRPRVSIFYTAHLNEQERLFITTLLLENMLGWMRGQSGTTSLRALFYIDEMFGYFPPYPKNPPTKEPLMRLLKQARAFGIGMILATQNPGDLDYKGLTNAGTWFIGRLQSENDQQKVMAGLRSMTSVDDEVTLQDVEAMVSEIKPRVFIMRNVHDNSGPLMLHTRWSMSYLRGPLTRQQVEVLMRDQRQQLLSQLGAQYGGYGYGQPQQNYSQQPGGQGAPAYTAAGYAAAGYAQPGHNAQPGSAQQSWQQTGAPPPPPTLPGAPPGFPPPSSGATPPPYPPGGQQANYGAYGAQAASPPAAQTDSQRLRGVQLPQGYSANQPPVSSSSAQFFLPNRVSSQQAIAFWEQQTQMRAQGTSGGLLVYEPMLLAQAIVRYQDRKASVYTARTYAFHVPDVQKAGLVHWEEHQADPVEARQLSGEPSDEGAFGELPPGLTDAKRLNSLQTELKDLIYNTGQLIIPLNPELKIYGNPDADFSQFQAAVQQTAREQRDAELDKLAGKYGQMMEKMEDKLKKKEMELSAERQELADRRREELYTTGEALFSLMKGRTNYTLSRMSRASRYRKQTKEDISESHNFIAEAEEEMFKLEQEFEAALQAVNEKWARIATTVEEYMISPYKKDIQMELFGIGWIPHWHLTINGQTAIIPAW